MEPSRLDSAAREASSVPSGSGGEGEGEGAAPSPSSSLSPSPCCCCWALRPAPKTRSNLGIRLQSGKVTETNTSCGKRGRTNRGIWEHQAAFRVAGWDLCS